MFFSRKKKYNIPPFTLGVFGKLPFYKDFLYSSFGSEFSELKMFFDSGVNQLHRSGVTAPLVKPARNFYIRMKDYQNDLVGCVWDSNDGLRAFPFILAAPFPKKIRKDPFSSFWTVLSQFWGYLGEYKKELEVKTSPTEFYQAVKGLKHQLNSIAPDEWEEAKSQYAITAGIHLNDDILTRIPLSDMSDDEIDSFLKALHLDNNPSMIVWPRESWRGEEVVSGYFGTIGFDEFQISFFPPEGPVEPELAERKPEEKELRTVPTELSQEETNHSIQQKTADTEANTEILTVLPSDLHVEDKTQEEADSQQEEQPNPSEAATQPLRIISDSSQKAN